MRAEQTISLAVLAVVALVGAACGGGEGNSTEETSAASTEQATGAPTASAPSATSQPTPTAPPTTAPTAPPPPEPEGWTVANPEAPWAARAGLKVVELNSTLFMLGGRTPVDSIIPADSDFWGDVWVSADSGSTWEQILQTDDTTHWAARAYFQAVTKNGQIYVFGGQDFQLPASTFFNDVWSSPDGVNWTQLSAAAPWDGRAGLSAAVLGDYIYVLGGSRTINIEQIKLFEPPRIYYNDVWRSRDGVDWELMSPAAPWEPRAGAVLLAKDDRLLLLGGEDGFTCEPLPDCDPPYFNDVWSSADGANWEIVTETAAWSKRPGHACDVIVGLWQHFSIPPLSLSESLL